MENTCLYCGVTDKQRCQTTEQALSCQHYKKQQQLENAIAKSTKNINPKRRKRKKERSMDHDKSYQLINQIARSTVAVIDALTQRGAFRGEELSTIGQLRDNCTQAIQLVEAYQQESAADTE